MMLGVYRYLWPVFWALPAVVWGQADFSRMKPDYTVDVCVLGGGPAGVAAATAAARNGAETLLIEQYGFLGGTSTAAHVSVFMSYTYAGGIFREVLERLDAYQARRGGVFDQSLMQIVLDDLVTEAGVRVLFYTRGIACVTAPGRSWQGKPRRTITGLVIHSKSGLQLVRAKVFVDCSGDADLAAWAGVPFAVGREADGATQPMTLIFRLGGCNYQGGMVSQFPNMQDYWVSHANGPNPGEITFNMTRLKGYSGLDVEDLSQATIEGRRQVLKAIEDLRANVPGFENAYLVALPAQIGVRETRRIQGATVLTGQQIIAPGFTYAHRFDVIARNDYDVDIHDPQGTGATIIKLKQPYEIPYRCLLPVGIDNLLVAGRPISADHVAHSSLRIQPTCYALGQAAGTAAALAVKQGTGPWEIGQPDDPAQGQASLQELQRLLIAQGADLGEKRAAALGMRAEWQRWQVHFRLHAQARRAAFTDVPPDHPAYEAVMALTRMGVFRGVAETEFGAQQPVSVGMAATVLARALAAMPEASAAPAAAPLPAHLQGQWWSPGLADCVARGIIPAADLAALDPNAPVSADILRAYLQAAFPAGEPPELPPGLVVQGAVTRAGLAYWLWPALQASVGQP